MLRLITVNLTINSDKDPISAPSIDIISAPPKRPPRSVETSVSESGNEPSIIGAVTALKAIARPAVPQRPRTENMSGSLLEFEKQEVKNI